MFDFSELTTSQLNEQFSGDQWPVFEQLELVDNTLVMQLYVPSDLRFFAGHFPEQPVLPGVVQIHWVGELANYLFGLDAFQALKNVKFNSMVLPDNKVSLSMEHKLDKQTLRFAFSSETDKFSSGVLAFTQAQEKQESK